MKTNAVDRERAREERHTQMAANLMLHQKSYTINQCDLWFYRASQSRARPYISGHSRNIPCSTFAFASTQKSQQTFPKQSHSYLGRVVQSFTLAATHRNARGRRFFYSTESKIIFGHSGRANAMWFSFDFFHLSRQSQKHNYYYDSAPPATVTAVAIVYLKETNVSPRRRQKKNSDLFQWHFLMVVLCYQLPEPKWWKTKGQNGTYSCGCVCAA